MSLEAANISSLAKIVDENMFNTVLKASISPMVQLDVPERYLKLNKDLKLKTTMATRLEKLYKVLLPNSQGACIPGEPRFNLTRLLAAMVWLKLSRRYINKG